MYKFTIRDLLWLTVVVALAMGWWVDRRNMANALATATESLATKEDHLNAACVFLESSGGIAQRGPGYFKVGDNRGQYVIRGQMPEPSAPVPNLPSD